MYKTKERKKLEAALSRAYGCYERWVEEYNHALESHIVYASWEPLIDVFGYYEYYGKKIADISRRLDGRQIAYLHDKGTPAEAHKRAIKTLRHIEGKIAEWKTKIQVAKAALKDYLFEYDYLAWEQMTQEEIDNPL